jgi:hypothetical protein
MPDLKRGSKARHQGQLEANMAQTGYCEFPRTDETICDASIIRGVNPDENEKAFHL